MSDHTPTPWRVNDSDGAGNCGTDIFPFLIEAGTPEHSDGPVIAEIYGDIAELDAAANAALIVKAVNAYEPMREALEAVDEMFSRPGTINKNTVRDKVRAALAQAGQP